MEHVDMLHQHQEKKIIALPSLEESAAFIAAGYDIDLEGRPLHPNLAELGPLPTGKGAYWGWGPNYTADPVVITTEDRPRILLIHRNDTGDLALPGGFVDKDELEEPIVAAYRELEEETGLVLTSPGTLIYQGVVDDPRTTANAWPETSAYVFNIAEPLPVHAGDDAKEADWYFVDELSENLYGSHAVLIQKALEIQSKPRTIEEILSIPAEDREITIIDAGHMAYGHFFTRHQNDHLFVKAHDSSRFSDAFREAHSRAYLQKEYTLFHHLKQQHFNYIPDRVALIDDTVLAMDALHSDDGWQWRAPKQPEALDQYIHDTLEAFNQLQLVTPPAQPEYHNSIKDTYSTIWEEGWDSIDDESLQRIIDKIRGFSNKWKEEQIDLSEALIASLSDIMNQTSHQARDEQLFMAHNDARQSNIAWHPNRGTRLVDWSWGDIGPQNADATMFLIDLVKSGHDVTPYLPTINQDYAQVLIGFWLSHSLWETRDGSQTVREHQVASAVAAYKVLNSQQ
jgi:ADP-ribose pyrophosphatase YjhB (NUDIX family)